MRVPEVGEGALHLPRRGAPDAQVRAAPPRVQVPDVEPADKGHPAVDGEDLAVVPVCAARVQSAPRSRDPAKTQVLDLFGETA